MNARNPAGRKGYRSPGRRALSDNGVSTDVPEQCRRDRIWKILYGALVRNVGKLQSFPQGATWMRRALLEKNAKLAQEMLQHRTTAIMNPAALETPPDLPPDTLTLADGATP